MMMMASGSFSIRRIPSRLRLSLAPSRPRAASSCLPIILYSGAFSISSMYLRRPMDLRIVARLVNVPPSQRWVDVELPARQRGFFDGFLRLLFAADEKNLALALGDAGEEIGRVLELLDGLAQVDDVDGVALLEDVRLHLRVPTLGLMAEMGRLLRAVRSSFRWAACLRSYVLQGEGGSRSVITPRRSFGGGLGSCLRVGGGFEGQKSGVGQDAGFPLSLSALRRKSTQRRHQPGRRERRPRR